MKKHRAPSLHQVTLLAMCRRVGRSLLMILLALLGVFSGMVLLNTVSRQEAGVEAVQKSTDIRCTVTNARGMSSERLEMSAEIVELLLGRTGDGKLAEFVTGVEAKATSAMVLPQGYNLCRIFSFRSDSRLDSINGVTVTMLGDWTEEAFRTGEKICLVPEGTETLSEKGRQYITAQLTGGEEEKLEVAGIVSGGPAQVIYCPYDMVLSGNVAFLVESCSFVIRDNTRLEESKNILYGNFVQPHKDNVDNGKTYGVLIDDTLYQQNMTDYETNLAILQLLLPVMVGMCCFIGFFVSYLSTKSRTKEYAVMRCLGMGRCRIFFLVFEELLLLTVIGSGLGFLAGSLLDGGLTVEGVRIGLLVAGALIAGAFIAALRVTAVNTMKLMKVEG